MSVAIVMPYYNDAYLLGKAVMGILGQTYQSWTLFLVDDGSEEGKKAADVLPKNLTKRVRVIEKPNGGCSSARNAALEIIRKDPSFTHVAYCDADDVWDEGHLDSQIRFLQGDADMVYSNARYQFVNGYDAFAYGFPNPDEFPGLEAIMQGDFIIGSTVVQKIKCLEVGNFDSELDAIENWDMWIRTAKAGLVIKKNPITSVTYVVKTVGNLSAKGGPPLYAKLRKKHSKEQYIDFVAGGLAGDFINALFVIKNICKRDDKKANLYITDNLVYGGDVWKFDINRTYEELKESILAQPYIDSFEILPSNYNSEFINLNKWRKPEMFTTDGYTKCWTECLSGEYGFDIPSQESMKWLFAHKEDSFTKGKVVIHRSLKRNTKEFPWKETLERIKKDIVFVTSDILEWEKFEFKNTRIIPYVASTLSDMIAAIGSCDYFIGNQSCPLAIASALNVPRLAELDLHDGVFYVDETKYSENLSWVRGKLRYIASNP